MRAAEASLVYLGRGNLPFALPRWINRITPAAGGALAVSLRLRWAGRDTGAAEIAVQNVRTDPARVALVLWAR